MRALLIVFPLSTACTWQPPLDTGAETPGNSITGTLVASGVDCPADTIVFAYDAENPPPPAGLGGPLGMATVSAEDWSAAAQGLPSAPYALTDMADGTWILSALMDMDGDFNPFSTPLAGATCGDLAGVHISDLETLQAAPVTVEGGTTTSGITLLLGTEYPIERPAFAMSEGAVLSRELGANPSTLQTFGLRATGVHTVFAEDLVLDLEGPCPAVDIGNFQICDPSVLDPCSTAFWVLPSDEDGDGFIDPHPDYPPETGLMDIWPRVYLNYLGQPTAEGFESELEEGESYTAEAFPLLAEAALAAATGDADWLPTTPGAPLPLAELSVTWLPVVKHITSDGSSEILDLSDGLTAWGDLPAGHWSVTVIAHSGQTWTLPNDIGLWGLQSTSEDFDSASQAGTLVTE
jgi:hypothetical protein